MFLNVLKVLLCPCLILLDSFVDVGLERKGAFV